jgi:putative transposase
MGLSLMPMLVGRTFSDFITKGDLDPADRAALTVEDLFFALVRWVVDIYHNTPHEGLGRETPYACWQRLAVTEGGVLPPPDMRLRRLVFGARVERTVHPYGIEVLGLTYQSRELQAWSVKARTKTVDVRIYPHDLGSIMVCLDGAWVEVPSLQPYASGLSARAWVAAAARLRTIRNREAALSQPIVLQAIRDIEARCTAALERAHVVVDEWSDERIAREEERLFIGLTLPREEEVLANPGDGLGSVIFTPPDPGVGKTPPPDDGSTPPRWTIED